MTSLLIEYPPEIYADPEQFEMPDDDSFDAVCGEVLVTMNRLLVFQCSICDEKYGHFPYFLSHLTEHYRTSEADEDIKDESIVQAEDLAEYVLDVESLEEQQQQDTELSALLEMESIEDEDNIKFDGSDDMFSEIMEMDEITNNTTDDKNPETAVQPNSNDSTKPQTVRKLRQSARHNFELTESSESSLPKTFECGKCVKFFSSSSRLDEHNVAHHSEERKYKCPYCDAAFKEDSNFRGHINRHIGEKRNHCDMCDKKFITRAELLRHRLTHTGEKPFVCSSCGLQFKTSGALSTHIKRHNNDRAHECSFCAKSFFSKSQLKDHIIVHTKERPHICSVCNASFARRKSLGVHMKLHTNAREYDCKLCPKSFNQKPALLAHMKTNHKVINQLHEQ